VVEQIGLPRLSTITDSVSSDDKEEDQGDVPPPKVNGAGQEQEGSGLRPDEVKAERWNGELPELRLEKLRRRVAGEIARHLEAVDLVEN
jgi:hypothetical protein